MATTYLADDFRGSGVLAGTSAPVKVAAVAAWADVSSGGSSNRSASGATWTEPATTDGGSVSAMDGVTTRGTGVLVAEVKVYGPGGIGLSFDSSGSYVYLLLDHPSYGGNGVQFETSGGSTYTAGAAHSLATPTVLRIEVDATVLRAYVDGTLFATHTYTVPSANVIDASAIILPPGVYPGSGATTLFADYIHVVSGTTSGPLGKYQPPTASSFGPTTLFGTPAFVTGICQATGLSSTTFGIPAYTILAPVTGAAPSTTFGTAAQVYDRTVNPSGAAPSTAFGEGTAIRDDAPPPVGRVSWLAPGTEFGTPTRGGGISVAAASIAPGNIPEPTATLAQQTTGAAPSTTFGAARSGASGAAEGFRATAFGAAASVRHTNASGFVVGNFGFPAARSIGRFSATGFTSAALGAPSALNTAQRTRSAVFRTSFGRAQAERFVA